MKIHAIPYISTYDHEGRGKALPQTGHSLHEIVTARNIA